MSYMSELYRQEQEALDELESQCQEIDQQEPIEEPKISAKKSKYRIGKRETNLNPVFSGIFADFFGEGEGQ